MRGAHRLNQASEYAKIEGMKDIAAVHQEHIALAEHLYAAFAQGNIPLLLEVLSEDIDWLFYGPSEIPFAGHYRGHAEVAQFFAKASETSDFLVFEPREFLPGANSVLVQGREKMRAKATGRIWETEWAHVFTIEGGKIAKLREYYDTAVMVEAFKE